MVVNSDLILLKDNTDLPHSSIEARWCLGLTSIREWTCLVNEHIAISRNPWMEQLAISPACRRHSMEKPTLSGFTPYGLVLQIMYCFRQLPKGTRPDRISAPLKVSYCALGKPGLSRGLVENSFACAR